MLRPFQFKWKMWLMVYSTRKMRFSNDKPLQGCAHGTRIYAWATRFIHLPELAHASSISFHSCSCLNRSYKTEFLLLLIVLIIIYHRGRLRLFLDIIGRFKTQIWTTFGIKLRTKWVEDAVHQGKVWDMYVGYLLYMAESAYCLLNLNCLLLSPFTSHIFGPWFLSIYVYRDYHTSYTPNSPRFSFLYNMLPAMIGYQCCDVQTRHQS